MKVANLYISAEEIFGKASRLVVPQANDAQLTLASLGTAYQIATAIVALLVVFILIRYSELIRHLLSTLFSKRTTDIHTYSAEINNIKILTSITGISLITLLVMRLSIITELRPIFAPLLAMPLWRVGGVILLSIFALIFAERVALYLIGAVGGHSKFYSMIWRTKMLYFSTTITLISPMVILALLTEGLTVGIALWLSIAVCFITLILFIKDTFSLFRAQRFSIFHWILYLCALEILPLSLLLAPIARG